MYVSDSLALATLEILVHGVPYESLERFVCIPVSIPEKLIRQIDADKLPQGWRGDPPLKQLQDMGNQWIGEQRFAVLKIPIAVIPIEFNYVINPNHSGFAKIGIGSIEQHAFDSRLSGFNH